MANPQLENGFTMIAHEIFEALAKLKLSGNCWQVLMVILRKTYGFKKKTDYISLSQFQNATNILQPNIVRSLNKLVKRKIIIKRVINTDKSKPITYRFNKDYDKWIELSKRIRKPLSVINSVEKHLSKRIDTKDTLTKDTKELSAKPEKVKKPTNPEHKFKIQKIMDTIEQSYHKKATGGECGQILKSAGSVGDAVMAIRLSSVWVEDGNYMAPIRRQLQNRSTWLDEHQKESEVEQRKFESWMTQEFGSPIQAMIAKIGSKTV